MRGITLSQMSVKNLRDTVGVLNHGEGRSWSKQRCIEWLTKNDIDVINVGDFCRLLLRVTVKVNHDGYAVGLCYKEMVRIVRGHFPHSAVNEKHFGWYATTMRSRGETIPVYR